MVRQILSPLLAGALFGTGLIVSGMTQPAKVVGFLAFTSGHWDPSLAFVMLGALAVFGPLQRRIRRARETPLWDKLFRVPERRDLDGPLVWGAALFGVGWGLAGYCPGPGLVSLASGGPALSFVLAMTVGMWLHAAFDAWRRRRSTGRKHAAASHGPTEA